MSEDQGFSDMLDAVVEAGNAASNGVETERPVMDTTAFIRVVESRRSVRQFTGEPIAPEIMHRMLDLAMLSPSSSNLQPWEFHWVRQPDKKKKLVEACLSQPAARTASELVVVVARTQTWRRNIKEMMKQLKASKPQPPKGVLDYYEKLVPMALTTKPFVLVPFVKWAFTRIARLRRPTPQGPIGDSDLRVWAHKSVALAAQTLMLAARGYNLDTCPMEGFDSWRVSKLLNLPADAEISMIIALGPAKSSGIYGPRLRFSRDLFVFEH